MSDLIDRDGFRANVGIVLMGEDGRLFLGRRTGGKGWQFPQGGMRSGESPEDSLFRELHEEVGLSPGHVELVGQTDSWLRDRLPQRFVRRDQRPLCVGQKQRWFLLRLTSAESDIRFDLTAAPEFAAGAGWNIWQREGSHLFQASGLRAGAARAGAAGATGRTAAVSRWWTGRTRKRPRR